MEEGNQVNTNMIKSQVNNQRQQSMWQAPADRVGLRSLVAHKVCWTLEETCLCLLTSSVCTEP